MAKIDIHPEVKEVLYRFSQNRSIKLRSTYKRNKEFLLETDIFSHPAWKEDLKAVDTTSSSVNKFNDKFGGISLFQNVSGGTSSIKSIKKSSSESTGESDESEDASSEPTNSAQDESKPSTKKGKKNS